MKLIQRDRMLTVLSALVNSAAGGPNMDHRIYVPALDEYSRRIHMPPQPKPLSQEAGIL